MPFTLRQTWPMEQGQAGRVEPDQVGGADFLQLDPADRTPARRGRLAHRRGAGGDHRRAPARRHPAARHAPAGRPARGVARGRRGGLPAADRRGPAQRTARRRDDGARRCPGPAPDPGRAGCRDRAPIDLRPGLPDLSAFPRQAWLRAERAALARTPDAELGYGDPRGTVALRTALATWLARSRGVRADPSAIVVVNGVAQGLALLAQVLARRGVTDRRLRGPGLARARATSWNGGDSRSPRSRWTTAGCDVDALARTGVGTVFTTPAHQYPTGVVLAPPRRRALLDWARGRRPRHRGRLRRRAPLRPRAGGRAARRSPPSTSSTWAACRRRWPRRCGWAGWSPRRTCGRSWWCASSGRTSPAPPSASSPSPSCSTSGAFERHLRRVRGRQRTRRDALLAALREHLPDARVHGVAAGLHLLVGLPDGIDDADVAERALASGVAVQPLSYHRLHPGPPGLVIGYAATTPDRLREGVRLLAAAVRTIGPSAPRP